MRRVILESPYAAPSLEGIEANIAYARAAIRDCLERGDAAIASHLLYTQPGILRDEVSAERELGMRAGMAWTPVAEAVVVYTDRGESPGMKAGITRAKRAGIPVEYRTIGSDREVSPAELRDLLLRVGHDVTVEALLRSARSTHDVRDAVVWAEGEIAIAGGDMQRTRRPCPTWLEDVLDPLPPTSP